MKVQRPRKVCKCGCKFEVKNNLSPVVASAPGPSASHGPKSSHGTARTALGPKNGPIRTALKGIPASVVSTLDARDLQLVDLASKGILQPGMVQALGITRQSVSARLGKLVRAGILVQVASRPRAYSMNPAFTQPGAAPGKKIAIQTHDLRVKLLVKGHVIEYEAFRSSIDIETKLKNWAKKHFHVNGVNFELNTKSIIFHTTGIGETDTDALDNAKSKAVEIRDFLESKFNLRLEFPMFLENNVHYIPFQTNAQNYDKLRRVWNDQSHKDLLETDDPLLANNIKQAIEGNNTAKLDVTTIQQQLQDIRDVQAQLVQSVSALVQALQSITTGSQSNTGPRPSPPGGMTI